LPNKACTCPTRPSGTLSKYDISIREGIQSQQVVFGEGSALSFSGWTASPSPRDGAGKASPLGAYAKIQTAKIERISMNEESSKSSNEDSFEEPNVRAIVEHAIKQTAKENADRNNAIVAGVDLEEALGDMLLNFMVDAKTSRDLLRSTLSNFAIRINMAYSLGLISPDEYADLNTIREIRNYFAHGKRGCTFADKFVTNLCNNFRIRGKNPIEINESWALYLDTASILLYTFSTRISRAKKQQRVSPEEINPATWADL
jgi:mannitol operon repressor